MGPKTLPSDDLAPGGGGYPRSAQPIRLLGVEAVGKNGANVFGFLDDFSCAAGQMPYGDVNGANACTLLGSRFIDGGAVTLTADKKLTTATISGTVSLTTAGPDGTVGTSAPGSVQLTVTGYGPSFTSKESGSYKDATGSYSYRMTRTGRLATVSGTVGDVTVTGASSGFIGSYRGADRQRIT